MGACSTRDSRPLSTHTRHLARVGAYPMKAPTRWAVPAVPGWHGATGDAAAGRSRFPVQYCRWSTIGAQTPQTAPAGINSCTLQCPARKARTGHCSYDQALRVTVIRHTRSPLSEAPPIQDHHQASCQERQERHRQARADPIGASRCDLLGCNDLLLDPGNHCRDGNRMRRRVPQAEERGHVHEDLAVNDLRIDHLGLVEERQAVAGASVTCQVTERPSALATPPPVIVPATTFRPTGSVSTTGPLITAPPMLPTVTLNVMTSSSSTRRQPARTTCPASAHPACSWRSCSRRR